MSAADLLHTPLHDWHRDRGGRLVEFAGWSMPVQYTTIAEEHRAVRDRVGLFDIGHMGRLTFDGRDAARWLDYATTNHVARLGPAQIQYSLLANGGGGVVDDILVYRLEHGFAVVCNASNRAAVVEHLERLRHQAEASLMDRTLGTAMIAVQGPRAAETLQSLFDQPLLPLKTYHLATGRLLGSVDAIVSRTGYTGEDGFELIFAAPDASRVWEALLESGRPHGILPCGLGARDTLRLEAAMPLYGHELSETINPFAAGIGWAVKLEKGEFVGQDALRRFKSDPGNVRIGLKLEGKRIARQGAAVRRDGREVGVVTSGTFSPTLERSVAMAFIDREGAAIGEALIVDVRGHEEPAEVVPLPFYRRSPGS